MLPPKAIPGACATTCGLVDVRGLCHHRIHNGLGCLAVTQNHGVIWAQGPTESHVWVRSPIVGLGWVGSGLMPIVPAATEGCVDVQDQVSHMSPCWCLQAMLQLGPYRSEWPVLLPKALVMSRPDLQLRAMSGSMVLL